MKQANFLTLDRVMRFDNGAGPVFGPASVDGNIDPNPNYPKQRVWLHVGAVGACFTVDQAEAMSKALAEAVAAVRAQGGPS